jgi:phenylacetate-CoA ligase
MFRKALFILGHEMLKPGFYGIYRTLVKNQWRTREEHRKQQEEQLRRIIIFAYKYTPYYRRLLRELDIRPKDVKKIEDLEKLPILTKEKIKRSWEELKPVNLDEIKYYMKSTGGTTGEPLKYRISKFDLFLSGAILYRGWGYAGYDLGDKVVMFGGRALGITAKAALKQKLDELIRNLKKLSAFDMSENDIKHYVQVLNSFKPKFIYGYPSAIILLANWIEENNLKVHSPLAVFTTSEKLLPNVRKKIQEVFATEVLDGYGADDGGVTAFECLKHEGLHIDTERSVMEVVNEKGEQIDNGWGEILATSLHNYAMPLIRYKTGDLAFILPEEDVCSCGREFRLLREIGGRTVDILVTPEGGYVHGWFFLYIFWEYMKGVKEYQVVQEKIDKIVVKIVPEEGFDESLLKSIENIIHQKSRNWNVEFKIVDKIERTSSGKYKFIINKVLENGK